MKKLATIFWLSAWATGAFSQGLINFINTPSTLSSAFKFNAGVAATDGPVGAWYYGLLIGSGNDTTKFWFTGAYATNLLTPGRFFGGTSVQVPGWIPGAATNYATCRLPWRKRTFRAQLSAAPSKRGFLGDEPSPPR